MGTPVETIVSPRNRILASLDKLPPFSPVLTRLLATLADEDVSFGALAGIIETDAVLAGNLLRVVNSALYGRASSINSVRHSVSILGSVKIRNLVLGLSVTHRWAGAAVSPKWDSRQFNAHSLAVAVLSDLIALDMPVPYPEGAFTAGLLHDVGKLLIAIGIPIASLTSLRALIHPDVAEKVLEAYWRKDGEVPKTYTINLGCRFVALAHAIGGFEEALRRIEDFRFTLEQQREDGMTPKNLALIRSVLTDGVWSRVVNLPEQLMRQARRERHAPVKAAVLAQIAVAVAILAVAPVRLGNLVGIRLGENLTKPGGPDSNYWLTFTRDEVKNRVSLPFKLDDTVTAIINEYVHDFRSALVRGSNADWLFPGDANNHKEKISFSTQIVDRVQKSTGLRITVHQFRHAAGALILKHRPGEYELVGRILGHKSVRTTIKFYLDLKTTQASEIFTDIIRNKLDFKQDVA